MIPNPGSDAAIDLGCTCPVLDNNHGAGFHGLDPEPLFWYASDCPLHTEGAIDADSGTVSEVV
jgi:hypothetical protein